VTGRKRKKAPEATAAPEEPPLPVSASASASALRKCRGKCGFFGTEERDGRCSKCYAKMQAELR